MKRLVAAAVTAIILGLILASVDRRALWENMRAMRPVPFAWAMFLFIPQNFVMAWRWKMMASNFTPIGWGRAIGMILGAQTMNVVLPSKLGDLTKAYFLKRSEAMDLARATNLVVFEKMLDLASLCLLALTGVGIAFVSPVKTDDPRLFVLLSLTTAILSIVGVGAVLVLYFIPTDRLPFHAALLSSLARRPRMKPIHSLFASSHEVMAMLQRAEARRGLIGALSIGLWVLHLIQIYLFFICLNASIPLLPFVSLMPLAIFVGLLPLSLFGMGTRDATIIFLFAPYLAGSVEHPASILAGVGLFVSLRYIVPALVGLPFLQAYLGLTRAARSSGRVGTAE